MSRSTQLLVKHPLILINSVITCAQLADQLLCELRKLGSGSAPSNPRKRVAADQGDADAIFVLLSFDEAHGLIRPVLDRNQNYSTKVTNFTCVRRALRSVLSEDIVSVFLSTTGFVFQFTSLPRDDGSSRYTMGLLKPFAPFSNIGYDQLATVIKEGSMTLDEIADMKVMVTLGRPL